MNQYIYIYIYICAVVSYKYLLYLEQEIRLGEQDRIRAVFERAINISLAPKKMKVIN